MIKPIVLVLWRYPTYLRSGETFFLERFPDGLNSHLFASRNACFSCFMCGCSLFIHPSHRSSCTLLFHVCWYLLDFTSLSVSSGSSSELTISDSFIVCKQISDFNYRHMSSTDGASFALRGPPVRAAQNKGHQYYCLSVDCIHRFTVVSYMTCEKGSSFCIHKQASL